MKPWRVSAAFKFGFGRNWFTAIQKRKKKDFEISIE
jgi:hypothetical protein